MITEAEAKTKWCPMARVVIDAQGFASGNRFPKYSESSANAELNRNAHCIGSACMAWRWAGPELYRGEPMPNAKGYCGAFGRPMGAQQ